MCHYEYSPLEDDTSIRIVTILPGKFDDPIRAQIRHEPLVPPNEAEPTRLSVKEIDRTLSRGWEAWEAFETLEGRIIFFNEETMSSSWTHPDPDMDRALYDPTPNSKIDLAVPVYEALSYAWGSPEKDKIIEVEVPRITAETASPNSSLHRQLPITRNLDLALRYLRFHDRPRALWIDAICIDQSNDQERSAQVRRMGEIYSLASRVVAWLGPSFADSRLALTTLERIGQQVEFSKQVDRIFPGPECPHQDWVHAMRQLPLLSNELAAMTELCKAPYLKRLWIIQELILASAKSVIKCGDEEISWLLFRRAIVFLWSGYVELPAEMYRATFPAFGICKASPILSVPYVIWDYSRRGCTDARDKVYACMNLMDPAVRRHIVVDYSKHHLDVFKQVLLVFLEQEKRLAQLPFAGNCTFPPSAWPTWLPNWSQPGSNLANFGATASSISAARVKYTAPNKLEATGLLFAHVSAGSQVLGGGHGVPGIVEFLKRLGIEDLQTSNYPTGETRLDAYLRTISIDHLGEMWSGRRYPTLPKLRDEVMSLVVRPEGVEHSALTRGLVGSHMIWVANCHVFTVSNGYIGLAGGPTQLGDKVFIILGCDNPMIVRPTYNGEYEVVGACYIHGVMDGEALLGALPHPWKVRMKPDKWGICSPSFHNGDSNTTCEYDPRLDSIPIPAEWEPMEFEWTRSDPDYCRKFRNKNTGEIINSDPRLFPEALLERGIPLRTITLI
ncbi:HET-domain-containing protein [Xylaria sp. FL1777]|nr:HET-domain-containing protein [Xylaria sp. FL1777]